MKRKLKFETLESKKMLAGDVVEEPTWHNEDLPTDVSGNGATTAFDALLIINEMARGTYTDAENHFQLVDPASVDPHPELFYDVNNDGRGSALDALIVINQIAREYNSHGEGELPITDGSGQQVVPVTYFHDQSMREEETWLSYQPL